MEFKEIFPVLISSGITVLGIIFLYLINFLIKNFSKKYDKNIKTLKLEEIVTLVLDAEKKLGKGQGSAKLAYVLTKLGKKIDDKKAVKKVNEVHSILKTAKNKIENEGE